MYLHSDTSIIHIYDWKCVFVKISDKLIIYYSIFEPTVETPFHVTENKMSENL